MEELNKYKEELKKYIEERIKYITSTRGKMRTEAYELGYIYEKFIISKSETRNKDELEEKIKSLIEN